GNLFTGGNDDFWTVGDFDLADSKLELRGNYVPEIGETFDIVSASQGSILGTFEGLPEGSTLTFNGVVMQITYLGGGVNAQKVTLTAIQNADEAIWSGAVSSDWFAMGNWENSIVPADTSEVTIPEGVPNQPVIGSGEVTIADLTVEEGNTFTLAEGAGLTVDGGTIGMRLFGDLINIAGELVVDNVGDENFGIDLFRGTLYVTPTGSVRLDSLGISSVLAASVSVAGTLEVANA
ncbi:MAG: hypothetical protein AAFN92_22195, partial [Bacteroidota bacterium]